MKRICPTCLARYDESHAACPVDGEHLLALGGDDPLHGTVVQGRYLVLATLGAGGMAVVYRAWQLSTRRPVALKVIQHRLAANHSAVKRFEREALVTASLRSPHTVTLFDYGQLPSGELYLVMELLEGHDLASILDVEKRLGPKRAADLLIQVCLSLEEAHAKQLVHRDLKPGNIFVVAVGHDREYAKVLDFGIVKILDEQASLLTAADAVQGTPAYMCPEQVSGGDVGPAADIYALGAILFELLSGRHAFRASTPLATMMRHLHEPAPRLETVLSDDDDDALAFAPVVARCLEKAPDARYPSVADLRLDLERVRASLATGLGNQVVVPPPDGRGGWTANDADATTAQRRPPPPAPPDEVLSPIPAGRSWRRSVTLALLVGAAMAAAWLLFSDRLTTPESMARSPVADPVALAPVSPPAALVANVAVEARADVRTDDVDVRSEPVRDASEPEPTPKKEVPRATPKGPSFRVLEVTTTGGLDRDAARKVVAGLTPRLGPCASGAGTDLPNPVTLTWMVSPRGDVRSVTIQPAAGPAQVFLTCLAPTARGLAFPTLTSGGAFGTVRAVVARAATSPSR